MKIKLSALDFNPFRNTARFPINREKVESLKCSISETAFWDNMIARPAPTEGRYKIAYGHHRLVALRELGIEEIDIPIRPLDDATMLKIMANENMTDWSANSAVILETVRAAKEFLEGELRKYRSWEEWASDHLRQSLINDKQAWHKIRGAGIGHSTIQKFLGKNWSKRTIQPALRSLSKLVDTKIHTVAPKTIQGAAKAIFKPSASGLKVNVHETSEGSELEDNLEDTSSKQSSGAKSVPAVIQADNEQTEGESINDEYTGKVDSRVQDVFDKIGALDEFIKYVLIYKIPFSEHLRLANFLKDEPVSHMKILMCDWGVANGYIEDLSKKYKYDPVLETAIKKTLSQWKDIMKDLEKELEFYDKIRFDKLKDEIGECFDWSDKLKVVYNNLNERVIDIN